MLKDMNQLPSNILPPLIEDEEQEDEGDVDEDNLDNDVSSLFLQQANSSHFLVVGAEGGKAEMPSIARLVQGGGGL